MVKELPALGYLYNNVCNDVTCAGMPVVTPNTEVNNGSKFLENYVLFTLKLPKPRQGTWRITYLSFLVCITKSNITI